MTVEIYSDIACPWCYIGEKRFAGALAALPAAENVEAVFRPYQLDPSLPDTPIPLRVRLREKFGHRTDEAIRHVISAAEQHGLDLRFDDAVAVNTLTAHRLLRLVLHEYGAKAQRMLASRLFQAHFTHGESVADLELLTDLAVSVGASRARVAAYLASDEGQREVREEIALAQRLGIRAVPTFIFDGRFAVQGAQPSSTLLRILEEVQVENEDADAA